MRAPSLSNIALTFAAISSTAFGGGQKASIRQQVLSRGWMDRERFMDGLEIAQVLPGPNILNLALYCGQSVRGVPGAVAAFLGASIPPFIIVLIAGALYFKFASNPFVQGALRGCAAGALGLTIGNALELSVGRAHRLGAHSAARVDRADRVVLAHAAAARAGRLRRHRNRPRIRALAQGEAMNGTLPNILHLLWTFSQLSVLGFGGGKGIIPQMHADAVDAYHWVTSQQFTQFYTIGKLVPGPTTIFAALIGYAATPARPLLGAGVATIGMFVPSSAIMVAFDALWERFQASPWRTIIVAGTGAGDRRSGLVERRDDRPRRAVSVVAYVVAAVVDGPDAAHETQCAAADPPRGRRRGRRASLSERPAMPIELHELRSRSFHGTKRRIYHLLEEMGTSGDQIWPFASQPFMRSPGPLVPGRTEEWHLGIHGVLEEAVPEERIVWRFRNEGLRWHAWVSSVQRRQGNAARVSRRRDALRHRRAAAVAPLRRSIRALDRGALR